MTHIFLVEAIKSSVDEVLSNHKSLKCSLDEVLANNKILTDKLIEAHNKIDSLEDIIKNELLHNGRREIVHEVNEPRRKIPKQIITSNGDLIVAPIQEYIKDEPAGDVVYYEENNEFDDNSIELPKISALMQPLIRSSTRNSHDIVKKTNGPIPNATAIKNAHHRTDQFNEPLSYNVDKPIAGLFPLKDRGDLDYVEERLSDPDFKNEVVSLFLFLALLAANLPVIYFVIVLFVVIRLV